VSGVAETSTTGVRARLAEVAILTGSVLVLILSLVNVSLSRVNGAVSAELIRGQQTINEGLRLGRINSEVIRAIAALSANKNDRELKLLLARHGITFSLRQDLSATTDDGSVDGGGDG